MKDWRPSNKVRPETWGAFLEYAAHFDVTLETGADIQRPDGTVGPLLFLQRRVKDDVLVLALPHPFSRDRLLRFLVAENAAKRLKLPMPHWTITM